MKSDFVNRVARLVYHFQWDYYSFHFLQKSVRDEKKDRVIRFAPMLRFSPPRTVSVMRFKVSKEPKGV